jgi:serralysin
MPISFINTSSSVAGTNVTALASTLTIIAEGASRVSTGGMALSNISTSDNCDVRVDGTLIGDVTGVLLLSNGVTDQHSLTVGATGMVLGHSGAGASLAGGNASVLNYGQIWSDNGAGVAVNGASCAVTNHGAIASVNNIGVSLIGPSAALRNFGTITSQFDYGVAISGANFGQIENFGTITGQVFAIVGDNSGDRVYNRGALNGSVALLGGNDYFDGNGGGAAFASGDSGLDTLRGGSMDDGLYGGFDSDQLRGNDGDDYLLGGSGADTLRGNLGDDTLLGGSDIDLLTGGDGADHFVWQSLSEMGDSLANDRVTDFRSGLDQIDVSAIAGLTFVGNAAFTNVAGQLRCAKGAGQLQIDQNGDGVVDFFIQLTPGKVFVADDLIL